MYKRIPLLLSVFTLISVITLPALGQVRINEVSHGEVDFMGSTNWVELFNEGDTEANVADLWLCDFPAYPQINSLTVLSGSTTIPAGGYLVLTWTDLDSDSEVGLYSSSSFGDSNALLDYMQYASAGHQREGVAVSAGQWTAGEFVALAATGESLQFFDNGSAGSADWASAPATPGAENAQAAAGGVRINEISHGEVDFMGSTNWVELYNEGDSEIDVAELWLCDFPAYPQINTLTVLSGSTTIPAGGYLVLSWTDLDGDSEVGVYSSSSFGDSNAMMDYMQYASAGHQREGVAVEAGQWTAGEFVALAATGESLQFFDNGSMGSADWASAPATPGAENAQAAAGGVRINEISHGEVDFMGSTNWVELYNEGDSEIDVAELWLCDFPAYPQINTLTVLSGSTTIPAGGYLVLAWTNLDDDAEVGLYSSQSFGDSTAVLDYMQYANAGHQREGVAEDAGEWVAGEFVALAATGESLQFFDSGSVGAADWASAPATPGEENAMVSTSNDEFDVLPEDFQLYSNYPNPFNPTTTISYDLSNAGHVMLKVYSVLGREIATLVDGVLPVGSYETAWDGRDSQGEVVPSGMYLYRLSFGNGQSQSRVMTLLK